MDGVVQISVERRQNVTRGRGPTRKPVVTVRANEEGRRGPVVVVLKKISSPPPLITTGKRSIGLGNSLFLEHIGSPRTK